MLPTPKNKPITLLDLYQRYTKDTTATESQVREYLLAMTSNARTVKALGEATRRQLVTSLVCRGYTSWQIAGALDIRPRNVISLMQRTMRGAWKELNNIERYYKNGRKHKTKESV